MRARREPALLSDQIRDEENGKPRPGAGNAGAVISAHIADPRAVAGSPQTPGELADGLASVIATAAEILEYPPDYQWAAMLSEPGVVVTLTAGSAESLTLAGLEGSALCGPGAGRRTALHIPAASNRAELSLLYASFLGRSLTRIPAAGTDGLIPGEVAGQDFSPAQLETMAALLAEEGLIQRGEEDGWVFDAGPAPGGPGQAMFHAAPLTQGRPYGSAPLAVMGVLPTTVGVRDDGAAGDPNQIGFWTRMPDWNFYQVVIPPARRVWGNDYDAVQMLTWVGRHVIRHVQTCAEATRTQSAG